MGGRYWLSGTQLAILKLFIKKDAVSIREDVEEIVEKIEDEQFIGKKHDLEKLLKGEVNDQEKKEKNKV